VAAGAAGPGSRRSTRTLRLLRVDQECPRRPLW
jgi:hypothetical protein